MPEGVRGGRLGEPKGEGVRATDSTRYWVGLTAYNATGWPQSRFSSPPPCTPSAPRAASAQNRGKRALPRKVLFTSETAAPLPHHVQNYRFFSALPHGKPLRFKALYQIRTCWQRKYHVRGVSGLDGTPFAISRWTSVRIDGIIKEHRSSLVALSKRKQKAGFLSNRRRGIRLLCSQQWYTICIYGGYS